MSTTWINRGHMYSPHVTPVLADLRFMVDSTNTNGLGVSVVRGQAVQNVFMHTTQTPGRGPNGKLNPNPAAGLIMVQLSDNYTQFYGHFVSAHPPLTGTPVTATTAGVAYQITALGTATLAQWLAAGLSPGITPAVGVSFIAIASATIGGAASVDTPTSSGIDHLEIVGSPTLSLGPVPVGGSPNVGAILIFKALLNTTQTAPADGTILRLSLSLNQSSVLVAGE